MSTDSATDPTPATDTSSSTKRTRFDTSSVRIPGSGNVRKIQAPKTLAESFIRGHVASLQPQIATILEKLGCQHIQLLAKLDNKTKQVTRMEEDDEFTPRSARVEFQFHMSKEATESAEFASLKEKTELDLTAFRKTLKGHIIEATRIERNIIHKSVIKDLVTSIRILTESFLVVADKKSNVDEIVAQLMDQHHEKLLKHCNISLDEFKTAYKDEHKLGHFPDHPRHTGWGTSGGWGTTTSTSTRTGGWGSANASANSSRFFGQGRPSDSTTVSDDGAVALQEQAQPNVFDHAPLYRALEAVFITAWDEYLSQCRKNNIAIQLKKLETQHFLEKATSDASMDLDDETAVSRPQLKELIAKAMKEENKRLKTEVERLSNNVNRLLLTKNGPRGQSGASQKKEKSSTSRIDKRQGGCAQSKSPSRRSNPRNGKRWDAQEVDGAASDTTADNSKRNVRRGRRRNERNAQPSRTKSVKPSRQSRRRSD
jgi:hypothetical protein